MQYLSDRQPGTRSRHTAQHHIVRLYLSICIVAAGFGCKRQPENVQPPPASTLVIISPHNEDIRYEFGKAFERYYQEHSGNALTLQWRDVGGGSGTILRFLRNIYDRAETAGIDILFGGGEYTFQVLAEKGLLERLELSEDVIDQIPKMFSGMELYDRELYWCGNVLSSFGFLYNITLLEKMGLAPPQTWSDLGSGDFFGLVMLADPTQSGSVAAAYEMIVQSAPDWPSGWARLMAILSNASKFADGSAAAANAPVIGEAPVAACIDFYGTMRVAKAPHRLGYVSPRGETGFTPDPVAILKNPPNPKLAKAFVDFLLSVEGQALWALPPSHPDGPELNYLNRPPIRRDFYSRYPEEAIPDWIARPYAEGAELVVDAGLREMRYFVLVQLVRTAAIDNLTMMRRAKRKLIETDFEPDRLAAFNRLPDNVDTLEKVEAISRELTSVTSLEMITTQWTAFFREQYRQVLAD